MSGFHQTGQLGRRHQRDIPRPFPAHYDDFLVSDYPVQDTGKILTEAGVRSFHGCSNLLPIVQDSCTQASCAAQENKMM